MRIRLCAPVDALPGSRAANASRIWCLLGAAAALALPIGIAEGWRPDAGTPPALWLIGLLVVSIGAPFFAVATTAPLDPALVFPQSGHPARHPIPISCTPRAISAALPC